MNRTLTPVNLGFNVEPMVYGRLRSVERLPEYAEAAISNVVEGFSLDTEIVFHEDASTKMHETETKWEGEYLAILCSCKQQLIISRALSVEYCPTVGCGSTYVITHRRVVVTFTLDQETEDKMEFIRWGLGNPYAVANMVRGGKTRMKELHLDI
jgi:hypothetical protein